MDIRQPSPEAPYDDATIYHGTPVRAVEWEGEGVEAEVSSQGQPLAPPETEKTESTVKSPESPGGTGSGPASPPIPAQPVDDQHGKGEPVGKGQEPVVDQEPQHGMGEECVNGQEPQHGKGEDCVDDQEPQHGKGEECVDVQEPQHVQGQEQLDECLAESTGPLDVDLEKFFASLTETHLDLQDFAVYHHFSKITMLQTSPKFWFYDNILS